MKTIAQDFCQGFAKELDPFADRLSEAVEALSKQDGVSQLNSTVMHLREAQQRLSTLQEKISGQQAFLLIFGPLKSGKSTLMNAISGAYVSEVSSLPAYPALVYVKHGDERRFNATTYAGEVREFRDNLAMAAAVQEDHSRLADAIRDVERQGEEFDPKEHYPEAIRRMDVEIPARDLAESGSVLVDTPGLYSRMRFGYDQMTRDFRDTAACAIFVVKTDNLFFEKVFEEFEELLGCFSRIFLVSNIDKSKKDLKPDGSLEASLESRDPQQVIEAFRSLSMSATLREAIDEGRIRIYPIDLLEAASQRLRDDSAEAGQEAAGEETALMEDDSGDTGIETAEDGFNRFLQDLTGYLNSSDYLDDFMVDSLRVARDLNREISDLAASEAALALERSAGELREELARQQRRREALEKLDKMELSAVFEDLYAGQENLLGEKSDDFVQRITDNLQEELSQWMESDESWNDLLDKRFKDYLARETSDDAETLLNQLRGRIDNARGGARFSDDQLAAFRTAGLDLEEMARGLAPTLGRNVTPPSPRIDIQPDDVPLKRSFLDYMMFRGTRQCRAQVFGDDGNAPVPARVKQKRLGGSGIEHLREAVGRFASEDWPRLQNDYVKHVLDSYASDFAQTLRQKVAELKTGANRSVVEIEGKLQARDEALKVLKEISESSRRFAAAVDGIEASFDIGQSQGDGEALDNDSASNGETGDGEAFPNLDENERHLASIEENLRSTNN